MAQSELVKAVWIQVDVARVTWLELDKMDYHLIAGLDIAGVVSVWDSDLQPLCRFNARIGFGDKMPLDLIVTQDYIGNMGTHYRLMLTNHYRFIYMTNRLMMF